MSHLAMRSVMEAIVNGLYSQRIDPARQIDQLSTSEDASRYIRSARVHITLHHNDSGHPISVREVLLVGCSELWKLLAETNAADVNDTICRKLEIHDTATIEMLKDFLEGNDTSRIRRGGGLLFYTRGLLLAHDVGCKDFMRFMGIHFAIALDDLQSQTGHHLTVERLTTFFKSIEMMWTCIHGSDYLCELLRPYRLLYHEWWRHNLLHSSMPLNIDPGLVGRSFEYMVDLTRFMVMEWSEPAKSAKEMMKELWEELSYEWAAIAGGCFDAEGRAYSEERARSEVFPQACSPS